MKVITEFDGQTTIPSGTGAHDEISHLRTVQCSVVGTGVHLSASHQLSHKQLQYLWMLHINRIVAIRNTFEDFVACVPCYFSVCICLLLTHPQAWHNQYICLALTFSSKLYHGAHNTINFPILSIVVCMRVLWLSFLIGFITMDGSLSRKWRKQSFAFCKKNKNRKASLYVHNKRRY